MKQIKNIKNQILLFLIFFTQITSAYTPKTGDLLFQDLNCGQLCNAITMVTSGYKNTEISHVGMIISNGQDPRVIEAIGNDVHLASLKKFLMRSTNKQDQPRVIVGRLKPKYQYLIPEAVSNAKNWIGLPYNDGFTPNNDLKTFYCSQLIYDAFQVANHGKPIFKLNIMSFKKNGKLVPAWKAYFKKNDLYIPQGELGTNPGMMSRSDNLTIIYNYGGARQYTQ